ncbi:hypothetical protein A1Q2_02471 [Trichosporon asahii var. asahii CBS 8904]|uniref:Uncharacterized protein n=1 Tax=Trichosporon asahii var. asahii (strain CBS 8904) TaxID=1220162 RepID=K1VGL3_TRIAC|nr:hypothetical protein A1Q2_02471 [Trichosporon asahii var. asahii CBS 8904]
MNGHEDKLEVVKRAVAEGFTFADIPKEDAPRPLSEVATWLAETLNYRELRSRAAGYEVGTTGGIRDLAGRIAEHEAWLEENDAHVPVRAKRVALASRLRKIERQELRHPPVDNCCRQHPSAEERYR